MAGRYVRAREEYVDALESASLGAMVEVSKDESREGPVSVDGDREVLEEANESDTDQESAVFSGEDEVPPAPHDAYSPADQNTHPPPGNQEPADVQNQDSQPAYTGLAAKVDNLEKVTRHLLEYLHGEDTGRHRYEPEPAAHLALERDPYLVERPAVARQPTIQP